MREYVQAVRAIWAAWKGDGKLDYEGKHYRFTLMTPNFVPEPYDGPRRASASPRSGRHAEGRGRGIRRREAPCLLHAQVSRAEHPADHQEGPGQVRPRARDFEISGGGFVVTGKDDEAVAKLFDWVRYRVAFYGSTPAYWPVFEVHGLGDLGRKLNAMTKAGQWDKIAGEVSDDVVHLFAAVGRHDQIAKAIEARFGGLVDSISASANSSKPSDMPPGPDPGYRAHPDALSCGSTTLRSPACR